MRGWRAFHGFAHPSLFVALYEMCPVVVVFEYTPNVAKFGVMFALCGGGTQVVCSVEVARDVRVCLADMCVVTELHADLGTDRPRLMTLIVVGI